MVIHINNMSPIDIMFMIINFAIQKGLVAKFAFRSWNFCVCVYKV